MFIQNIFLLKLNLPFLINYGKASYATRISLETGELYGVKISPLIINMLNVLLYIKQY